MNNNSIPDQEDWTEQSLTPHPTQQVIFGVVFTANHLTVTDKQTIRKKLNINHKNKYINAIQIKENKQLNIKQKQNYPGLVASYDTQPGNEVGVILQRPRAPHRPADREIRPL